MEIGKRGSKIALVLAGGGFTGAVYHIGALRAINDLLVDRTVNDFDIFVGTSAGSLVSALLANGFSPDLMLKSMHGSHPEIQSIQQHDIFDINPLDMMKWGLRIPPRFINGVLHYLTSFGDMTLFDFLWTLSETLPAGLYDVMALEHFLHQLLTTPGHTNNFDALDRELYIIATDLDTGERAVFGKGEVVDVPISMAVAASSALPFLYRPVRIGDKEYVDGGMRGTASLDLAIERGAELVVCINPLVPYDTSKDKVIPDLRKIKEKHLSEKGVRLVADQVLRIISHSGLQYHVKQLRRRHPDVDIILIEPRSDDYQMFYYNIMRYSARMVIAQHGFESVTLDLAEDYPRYKSLLARHGISISRRLVIEEMAEIQKSRYDPEVIRRVLEERAWYSHSVKEGSPVHWLRKALAELESVLEDIENET
jgi:NTE family protein